MGNPEEYRSPTGIFDRSRSPLQYFIKFCPGKNWAQDWCTVLPWVGFPITFQQEGHTGYTKALLGKNASHERGYVALQFPRAIGPGIGALYKVIAPNIDIRVQYKLI